MTVERYQKSNIVKRQIEAPVAVGDWTQEQMALVKRTVAKDATSDELALFLTMANRMQLDPFAKQIYFSKIGGKLTIMTSIDGCRLIAHRTGKWDGCKRGVKRDESGNITHGWCAVWIKGCSKPVYEETPFYEYYKDDSKWKGNWSSKPETMIKKCAEMAALRIAFPQELSLAYIAEEMGSEEPSIETKTNDLKERFKDDFEEIGTNAEGRTQGQENEPGDSSEEIGDQPQGNDFQDREGPEGDPEPTQESLLVGGGAEDQGSRKTD